MNTRWSQVITLGALLIGCVGCATPLDAPSLPSETIAEIRLHLDRLEALGFSGAVAITDNGQLVLKRSVGYADQERETEFTTQTGFFIASVTKHFTSALVLALEDRGVLSIQDRVTDHLDDVPPALQDVTLHQLMSHSSGVRGPWPPSLIPMESGAEVLAAGLSAPLEFEPGTQFSYSNFGYAFLTALVEEITGRSYEALMHEYIFDPAGMDSTSIATERARWADRPLATAYNGFLPQGDALMARPYGRNQIGASGVVATLDDMVRWEQALIGSDVLSGVAREKMFTPGLNNYGLGWTVVEPPGAGGRAAIHDGHILPEGFNAYYFRLLDRGVSVIVFANRGDLSLAERVAGEIFGILAGRPEPSLPDVGMSTTRPAVGTYASEDGARARVHQLGAQYYLEPLNQAAANLFLEQTEGLAAAGALVEEGLHAEDIDPGGPLGATLATVRGLEPRLGPYSGHEVLYSVHEDGWIRTHLRHRFGETSVFTRLDVVDGEFVGGTDAGAFISGGRGLTPALAYLTLAPTGGDGWIAYDFWGQRAVELSITDGALTFASPDGDVRLRPSPER